MTNQGAISALLDAYYGIESLKDFCKIEIIEPAHLENVGRNIRKALHELDVPENEVLPVAAQARRDWGPT